MEAFVAPFTTVRCAPFFSGRINSRPASFPVRSSRRANMPSMVISTEDEIALRITGNNIQITESLRGYVTDKLRKVFRKYTSLITKMDVHLTVEHNHAIPNRHKAEVLTFAGKTILRAEMRASDMYEAIDLVEEKMSRKVRKFKERKSPRKGNSADDELLEVANVVPALDGEEATEKDESELLDKDYADKIDFVPPVNGVVKRKVFPMPLQTVEEAVLCCEYVDHPWYIFRNAETKEISLVYKRNHGGYGLIEPSNPNAVAED